MKSNIGTLDRAIRFLAAAAIAVLYFTGVLSGGVATALGIAALLFAVTGAVRVCPAYTLLGISTRKQHEASKTV